MCNNKKSLVVKEIKIIIVAVVTENQTQGLAFARQTLYLSYILVKQFTLK